MSSPCAAPWKKPRVFVFCRPYLVADFRNNVAPLDEEFEFTFLTDGFCEGTPDTRADFYAALRDRQMCNELSAVDEDNVRTRCRLLRNIDRGQAHALMHAMASVLARRLDEFRPSTVLCHLVDEYIIHLLSLLAEKRSIPFVNYFASYFPGRVQLTEGAHGVPLDVYEPSDAEVREALNLILQPRFRQNYTQRPNYSVWRHFLNVQRYKAKVLVFSLRSLIERDRWNLHYRVTPYVAERRRVRDFPRKSDFHSDWRRRIERLASERGGPTIYLPLAYFPEATTDYWVRNLRMTEYERCLIEIIRSLAGAPDGSLIIKEHLHMMGARARSFYSELMSIPNVVSVHPLEHSNELLSMSDAVVMGAGSVGIEATVRNKPVFSYCDTSYWFKPSRATFLNLDDVGSWGEVVRNHLMSGKRSHVTDNETFIRACLRSNVPARGPGRIWPLIDVQALRTTLHVVQLRRQGPCSTTRPDNEDRPKHEILL